MKSDNHGTESVGSTKEPTNFLIYTACCCSASNLTFHAFTRLLILILRKIQYSCISVCKATTSGALTSSTLGVFPLKMTERTRRQGHRGRGRIEKIESAWKVPVCFNSHQCLVRGPGFNCHRLHSVRNVTSRQINRQYPLKI